MKKIAVLALSLAMLAVAVPATADDGQTVREQNREFILEKIGDDWDPDADIDVRIDGVWQTMNAEDALEMALDGHERVNLEEAAQASSHGGNPSAGDIWIDNFGQCFEHDVQQDTPVPFVPVHLQLWIYDGGIMQGTAPDGSIYIGWTDKSLGDASGATYLGQGFDTCFVFFGFTWGTVYMDGVLQ